MKTNSISAIAGAILAAGTFQQASAAISINNFSLTATSINFNISGILPIEAPAVSPGTLYFVNANPEASPRFAYNDFHYASTITYTGAQTLDAVLTGADFFGDYFAVRFGNRLIAGETLSGTLTANWSVATFDPTALSVSGLNLFWGSSSGSTLAGGAFLTAVAVPEPTALLLGAFNSLALLRRKRTASHSYNEPICQPNAGEAGVQNEPTRQPMVLAVPIHLKIEIHTASR